MEIRCHRCNRWIGEAREPMDLVGMFEKPTDRNLVPQPRDAWLCKSCGWVNVFRVARQDRPTRQIEVKQHTA